MKKGSLLIFAAILIAVVALAGFTSNAEQKETIAAAEQAAKAEENADVEQAELKEEAATPIATTEDSEPARGELERAPAPVQVEEAVTVTAAPAPAVEQAPAPAVEPVYVPPAKELDIEVPDDWDAFINGDTAPTDESM